MAGLHKADVGGAGKPGSLSALLNRTWPRRRAAPFHWWRPRPLIAPWRSGGLP